jgi:hypothetical protein
MADKVASRLDTGQGVLQMNHLIVSVSDALVTIVSSEEVQIEEKCL